MGYDMDFGEFFFCAEYLIITYGGGGGVIESDRDSCCRVQEGFVGSGFPHFEDTSQHADKP